MADWTEWDRTTELRRFDDTGKLTNPRLQQRWTRVKRDWSEREYEWRDVPLVWEPSVRGDGITDDTAALQAMQE